MRRNQRWMPRSRALPHVADFRERQRRRLRLALFADAVAFTERGRSIQLEVVVTMPSGFRRTRPLAELERHVRCSRLLTTLDRMARTCATGEWALSAPLRPDSPASGAEPSR